MNTAWKMVGFRNENLMTAAPFQCSHDLRLVRTPEGPAWAEQPISFFVDKISGEQIA